MKLENIKSKILPPFDNVGIGHAVRYGEWLFISGQIPIDKEGHIVGKNDVRAQTIQVYKIIQGILDELGSGLDNEFAGVSSGVLLKLSMSGGILFFL